MVRAGIWGVCLFASASIVVNSPRTPRLYYKHTNAGTVRCSWPGGNRLFARRLNLEGGSFQFEVVEHDGRENHAGDAHEPFPNHQPEQRQPERVANAIAHDLAVEEILKLVDDQQE